MSASSKRPAIAALCIAALFNAGAAAWETVSAELYLSGRSESPNPYQSRYILDSMARVKALVGPGKVVLAWDSTAYPVQASGMKVVSIPRPFPEVPDSVERQAASKAFFTDSIDPAARCAILARYDVAALLYPTDLLAPDLRQALATLGRPVVIHDLTLVPLTGSACAAVTDSHDTTPSP